jgi:hypothetical protein
MLFPARPISTQESTVEVVKKMVAWTVPVQAEEYSTVMSSWFTSSKVIDEIEGADGSWRRFFQSIPTRLMVPASPVAAATSAAVKETVVAGEVIDFSNTTDKDPTFTGSSAPPGSLVTFQTVSGISASP